MMEFLGTQAAVQNIVEIDKPDIPIPVPVPSDWENPMNPETWDNLPGNITTEQALQALRCVSDALYDG